MAQASHAPRPSGPGERVVAQASPMELLGTLAGVSPPSLDTVRAAVRFSDDPDGLVASVVDGMSRSELEIALVHVTGRDLAELEQIGNLHEFAKSYAQVAMAGILTEAPSTPESGAIEFATRMADLYEQGPPRTLFDAASPRIFGVFPLETAPDGELIAKWYRVDQPELLMLEEVPVISSHGEAFVRFDRPEGWPEGDYRLEVYAPGDEFELIAAGSYETRGDPRPVRVSFQ